MFKSKIAATTSDVWFRIDMGSSKKIVSLYMSLYESDTSQYNGMQVLIGGSTRESTILCYEAVATYSRWVSCGNGISG
jgi:hypothetical protein